MSGTGALRRKTQQDAEWHRAQRIRDWTMETFPQTAGGAGLPTTPVWRGVGGSGFGNVSLTNVDPFYHHITLQATAQAAGNILWTEIIGPPVERRGFLTAQEEVDDGGTVDIPIDITGIMRFEVNGRWQERSTGIITVTLVDHPPRTFDLGPTTINFDGLEEGWEVIAGETVTFNFPADLQFAELDIFIRLSPEQEYSIEPPDTGSLWVTSEGYAYVQLDSADGTALTVYSDPDPFSQPHYGSGMHPHPSSDGIVMVGMYDDAGVTSLVPMDISDGTFGTPIVFDQHASDNFAAWRDFAWDGTNWWASEPFEDLIGKFDSTGTLLSTVTPPVLGTQVGGTGPLGLTTSGGNIWYAVLNQDADDTLVVMTTAGVLVTSWTIPSAFNGYALHHDGDYLWVTSTKPAAQTGGLGDYPIGKFTPTGSLVSSIASPSEIHQGVGALPSGVVWIPV